MTILHVTDFHYNKTWFDWLLHRAPAHDLAVISGDLLDLSSVTPHRKQSAWVADWLEAYPRPLCVCSGNHDLEWDSRSGRWTPAYWLREIANHTVWVDSQRVTFDGLSVLNIGATTHPKGGDADVWVVHAPPANTFVACHASGGNGGDPALVLPVKRYAPRLVLSGHVHTPARWCERDGRTLYVNPGYKPGAAFPNHVLVDTTRMTCRIVTDRRSEAPVVDFSQPALAVA